MPSGTPRYFVFPPLNAVKQASSRVFFSPTLFLQVASQLTDMITRFLQLVWKQPTPLKVSCVCVCWSCLGRARCSASGRWKSELLRRDIFSCHFIFSSARFPLCVLARLLIDLRCGSLSPRSTHAAENLVPSCSSCYFKYFGFWVRCKITVFARRNHEGLGANGFIIPVSGTIQSN